MHPIRLLLWFCVLCFGSYGFGAQGEPVTAPSAPTDTAIRAKAAAPAAAETPAAKDQSATATPAVEAAAPVTSSTESAATTSEPAASPSAAVAPAPVDPLVTRAIAVMEAQYEAMANRLSLMDQLLVTQQEREKQNSEAMLERENRNSEAMMQLVTLFGGAFAGICMLGLLAAAFLNYRALVAVQDMQVRMMAAAGIPATPALSSPPPPPPANAAQVPGIDRVQASGQRFQSRMTGLEQRLAELEHLAGRESPATDGAVSAHVEPPPPAVAAPPGEPALTPPPVQIVPRAMILVHKAQALANLGKLTEALGTLDDASALDGAQTEVHLARGQVLEKLGRLGDALKAYDTAVDTDDHSTSALLLKAGVLNRQERFTEALACYERALEVHRAAV